MSLSISTFINTPCDDVDSSIVFGDVLDNIILVIGNPEITNRVHIVDWSHKELAQIVIQDYIGRRSFSISGPIRVGQGIVSVERAWRLEGHDSAQEQAKNQHNG